MDEEKLTKQALWVRDEKLRISKDDTILEVEIEFFDDRTKVTAKLPENKTRTAVMNNKKLAMRLAGILSNHRGVYNADNK